MRGFTQNHHLRSLFAQVDADKNGTLDFSEFCCLLYYWSSFGSYEHFFVNPQNVSCIQQAFSLMGQCMQAYDQDQSRMLSFDELNAFFNDQMPECLGSFGNCVNDIYPESMRGSTELDFPTFMYLIYKVPLCKYLSHA